MEGKRTLKEIFEIEKDFLDEICLVLDNGTEIEGYLIQERVDKSKDTEGYHIYDIRSGECEYKGKKVPVHYCTLEENVVVDWADSIATLEPVDFGCDGYLDIVQDKDNLEFEYSQMDFQEPNQKRIWIGIFASDWDDNRCHMEHQIFPSESDAKKWVRGNLKKLEDSLGANIDQYKIDVESFGDYYCCAVDEDDNENPSMGWEKCEYHFEDIDVDELADVE